MLLAAFICLFVPSFLWLVYRSFLLKQKKHFSPQFTSKVFELAEKALLTNDVPIGALLIYKDEIIGQGHNSVLKNGKAGEHAEINAISDALGQLGPGQWAALDRRYLVLVSTFEPCLMCMGACVNYNVPHIYFFKEKDVRYILSENKHFLTYMLARKQVHHQNEQEILFSKHPSYPGNKKRRK